MWETINNTLNGNNALSVLIFVLVIVIIISILAKADILKVKTRVVKIGSDENERTILRQQNEWTHTFVDGILGKCIATNPKLDKIKTQLVLEKVYDEIVTWIMYNHITRSEMYIQIKCEKIRALINSMEVGEWVRSVEFQTRINKWVKEIINRLVDIREHYSK